jgi:hypothetical protein
MQQMWWRGGQTTAWLLQQQVRSGNNALLSRYKLCWRALANLRLEVVVSSLPV